VLNVDDPASERIVADCKAERLTYGLNPLADVQARITEITADGSRFTLTTPLGSAEVHTRLVGRHNVVNCLAAVSASIACGVDLATVRQGLTSVQRVAGRLERIARDGVIGDPTVLVDYAHTDDALRNVLSSLHPLKRGRLIVVFGCGGDRDRSKRPRMASVAALYADRIVVTSDNPRTEPPEAIIEQIMAGFEPGDLQRTTIQPDRLRAIEQAIADATTDDVVLIAGKGHENYQVLGRQRVPFDDRQVALTCLQQRPEPA
jgi:UDP-N-acetylmuramoyl-L-alanyl-D-glutamate--2,6-diaminopimelate ligase